MPIHQIIKTQIDKSSCQNNQIGNKRSKHTTQNNKIHFNQAEKIQNQHPKKYI